MTRRFIWSAAALVLCVSASGALAYDRTGWYADLSTYAYGVDGTVTIVDEFTVNVQNFTYTGGGIQDPGVFLYLGSDTNSFGSGVGIGSNLWGQNFSNADLGNINVPGGLDGYNAISVWCVGAGADFGSGAFVAPEPASMALFGGLACALFVRCRRATR